MPVTRTVAVAIVTAALLASALTFALTRIADPAPVQARTVDFATNAQILKEVLRLKGQVSLIQAGKDTNGRTLDQMRLDLGIGSRYNGLSNYDMVTAIYKCTVQHVAGSC
jgi:hypothetical protein